MGIVDATQLRVTTSSRHQTPLRQESNWNEIAPQLECDKGTEEDYIACDIQYPKREHAEEQG